MHSLERNPKFDPSANPYVARTKVQSHISWFRRYLASFWKTRLLSKSTLRATGISCRIIQDAPEFVGLKVEKRFKRIFKRAQKLRETRRKLYKSISMIYKKSPRTRDEVWLQDPDPWPKLRHEKHRVVTAFCLIYRILKKGGRFVFDLIARPRQFLQNGPYANGSLRSASIKATHLWMNRRLYSNRSSLRHPFPFTLWSFGS